MILIYYYTGEFCWFKIIKSKLIWWLDILVVQTDDNLKFVRFLSLQIALATWILSQKLGLSERWKILYWHDNQNNIRLLSYYLSRTAHWDQHYEFFKVRDFFYYFSVRCLLKVFRFE